MTPKSQAQIYFLEGNYDQAKRLFQQVIEQAEQIDWQRMTSFARNFLADIAIVQNEFDAAEKFLKTGLPVAECNRDKRYIAFYQRSFARLEQARENADKAHEWATMAMEGFKRLGMTRDAEEMRALLDSLEEGSNASP